MKKTSLILSVILLFSFLTGCVNSKSSKQISELDKHVFSYDFTLDYIEDIKDESVLDKWAKKAAKQIENGEHSELEVNALLSNLERAEYHNEEILTQAKNFFKVDSINTLFDNGDVIKALEHLEELEYNRYAKYDYYNIYEGLITSDSIINHARKQLTKCQTESGYYDDEANKKTERAKSDDGLLKNEWNWDYEGDFCFETKFIYNSALNNIINTEFKGMYYKDQAISGSEDFAKAIQLADEVYIDEDSGKIIAYSKHNGIATNFIEFDIEN